MTVVFRLFKKVVTGNYFIVIRGNSMTTVIVIKSVFEPTLTTLGVVRGPWASFRKTVFVAVRFTFISRVIRVWGKCRAPIIKVQLGSVGNFRTAPIILRGGIGQLFRSMPMTSATRVIRASITSIFGIC